MTDPVRCEWVPPEDRLYVDYHDSEWGKPLHDDHGLFEFLILEGAQAGLSWKTILYKRENYRKALNRFDPALVAGYGDEKVEELLSNRGIVRNRLKVVSTIINARAFLKVQEEFGSFDLYIWAFFGNKPRAGGWKNIREIPARTRESDAMSRDLRKRGFKFVGSTICYSFMQAVGMINDHTVSCFRYQELLEG